MVLLQLFLMPPYGSVTHTSVSSGVRIIKHVYALGGGGGGLGKLLLSSLSPEIFMFDSKFIE